jgi:hypothetical protein
MILSKAIIAAVNIEPNIAIIMVAVSLSTIKPVLYDLSGKYQ